MLRGARSSKLRCSAGRTIGKDTPLSRLIALDVDFHSAIYRLAGNPAIEEMIAPQWPHMRRSMATVLAELDYRESAWTEHEAIAAQIFAGNAEGRGSRGTGACADAPDGMTEETVRGDGRRAAVEPNALRKTKPKEETP